MGSATRAKDDHAAAINCRETCLQIWTPIFSNGMPRGGSKLNPPMIGTTPLGDEKVATYNGWPLYKYLVDR